MKPEDIDELLESGRYKHLSETTLLSYRDSQLNKVQLALADAHLKLCLDCSQKLTFLRKEADAVANYVITEEDRAANQRFLEKINAKSNVAPFISIDLPRLTSYINDFLTGWLTFFGKEATLGSEGEKVWSYESKDGVLSGWAKLENDASLTVKFLATDLSWKGVQIRFRLGPFTKTVTLELEGDSKVVAEIRIPRRERARNMADISIEVL